MNLNCFQGDELRGERAGAVRVVGEGPGAGPHLLRDGALQPAHHQGADH